MVLRGVSQISVENVGRAVKSRNFLVLATIDVQFWLPIACVGSAAKLRNRVKSLVTSDHRHVKVKFCRANDGQSILYI